MLRDLLTFRREIREIIAPISKEGIHVKEIRSKGDRVLATEFPDNKRPEEFTPSTVIVNGGYAVWELEISKDILRDLIDMSLKIETIRTHGMLHSAEKGKSASIFVNDQLIDKIYLVKPHPHGEDYGVESRRRYPIFRYIQRNRTLQTIRVETEENVYWDIDSVVLEPIVLRKEITPTYYMIFGALISAVIGVLEQLWLL